MARLVLCMFIGLLALLPSRSFAGPAEDASATVDRWAAAFNANDADAVVKIYAPDALLHGTASPMLREGSTAIRDYFKGLPGSGNTVKIGERHLVVLDDAAVMAVGFYEFKAGPARFTFIVVRRGNEWVIAHHHSSRLPAPPQQ